MKKIMILVLMIVLMFVTCVGCGNRDLVDTVRTYDYAIVSFPDGNSETIKVKQWRDYEDGEQIQIIAEDGTVYLVHSANCVLVREK